MNVSVYKLLTFVDDKERLWLQEKKLFLQNQNVAYLPTTYVIIMTR